MYISGFFRYGCVSVGGDKSELVGIDRAQYPCYNKNARNNGE